MDRALRWVKEMPVWRALPRLRWCLLSWGHYRGLTWWEWFGEAGEKSGGAAGSPLSERQCFCAGGGGGHSLPRLAAAFAGFDISACANVCMSVYKVCLSGCELAAHVGASSGDCAHGALL